MAVLYDSEKLEYSGFEFFGMKTFGSVSSSVSGTCLLCCESGGSLTMMATDCRRGVPPDDDGNPYGNRPLFRTNWKKYAFGTGIGLFSVRREKNCGSSNVNNTGQIQCEMAG